MPDKINNGLSKKISRSDPDWARKQFAKVFLAISVLPIAGWPTAASACSFYAGIGIYFDKNSAEISEHEMQRLEAWAANIHETYPGADSLDIDVVNEIGEIDGQNLGRRRELALRLALIDLNITAPVVHTSDKIDAWPKNYYGENVKRADVSYHPVAPFHRKDCNPVPIKPVE